MPRKSVLLASNKILPFASGANDNGWRIRWTELHESFLASDESLLVKLRTNSLPHLSALRTIRKHSGLYITDLILLRSLLGNSTNAITDVMTCLLYTSPSPRDRTRSRMPS